MNLGIQAFRYAAEPFFFSNANDKNSPALFARVNHYFTVAGCVVLLGVSLNMELFKYFIGNNFWDGLNIVPILLLAYLFLGVYYNISIWFKLTNQTHFGTLITLAGVVITIAGNYLLIPLFGYMGSSWAALLCYFSMTVLCYLIGQRYYPIPYSVLKDLSYITCTMLVIYAFYQVRIVNMYLSSALNITVTLLAIGIVYLLEKDDLKKNHVG
jgi:O-antigen/teichoic acid export membrane protein